jgi:hypothetical protein
MVLFSGIVLPEFFVAASAKAEIGGIGNSALVLNKISSPAITVVTATPASAVVVPSSASVSAANSNCQTGLFGTKNFVQDTGLIKLNEPAGCYSLAIAAHRASSLSLAVRPAEPSLEQVVVAPHFNFFFPNFDHAPFSQNTVPILPLAVFFSIVVYELSEPRKKLEKLSAKASFLIRGLTIHQLGILRC